MTPYSEGTDSERADPAAKAERIRGEGPSGPSPSSNGRKWTEEQKAAASERMKASHAAGTAPRGGRKPASAKAAAPDPITEDEERMVGVMMGAVWNIGGPMVKLAKLDKEEEFQLGRATVPVLRKYMPMLGDWQAELTLLVTVAALATAKRGQWKAEHPAEAEGTADIDLGFLSSGATAGGAPL